MWRGDIARSTDVALHEPYTYSPHLLDGGINETISGKVVKHFTICWGEF